MRRPSASWLLITAFLSALFLAAALGQRKPGLATPPLKDWSLSELMTHLKRAGLDLRSVSTQKSGAIGEAVFLTSTDKRWDDLNALAKDPRRIGEWRGVLYCEHLGQRDPLALVSQWGEDCLVAGPFLFYGDRELLNRVRAVLAGSSI